MSAPVDVLAVMLRDAATANDWRVHVADNSDDDAKARRVESDEARAAVAELIEAARFTLQPGTHITSGVKLQQSRERLRAALARVGGAA